MERTLVLIKPDAVAKNHIGEILKRYEEEGFVIKGLRMLKMDEALAAKHYMEHIDKFYYHDLEEFMTSGPLVAAVLEGSNVIAAIRALNGATNPKDAEPGTIRRQFAESGSRNAVHASDTVPNANREIALFFAGLDLFD